jgi:hypothetical protein
MRNSSFDFEAVKQERGLRRALQNLAASLDSFLIAHIKVIFACRPGDQMSFSKKNRPKCRPTHLLSKLMHKLYF